MNDTFRWYMRCWVLYTVATWIKQTKIIYYSHSWHIFNFEKIFTHIFLWINFYLFWNSVETETVVQNILFISKFQIYINCWVDQIRNSSNHFGNGWMHSAGAWACLTVREFPLGLVFFVYWNLRFILSAECHDM